MTEQRRCSCCGGKLPKREIWEQNRDRPEATECPGHIDADTGRCGGFYASILWIGSVSIHDYDGGGTQFVGNYQLNELEKRELEAIIHDPDADEWKLQALDEDGEELEGLETILRKI